ncbi:MAG: DegT/DnrJ/EryC1/StrS family aminotransferase [Trueperaceae bacterium]|nr:DegT/DnrJ/EryC1/StrS family aminotransferase [Trueperaceae bacterium]
MPSAPHEPIPMLDLAGEVETLWDELQPAIERVLRSGQFVGGPEVAAFEAEAAEDLEAGHAVGLNSGTDALVIALEALGIGAGDEVITTPFSFFATSEAILRRGATPVFGDIDPETLNLDPDTIPPLLSDRTRAILPVHLFGLPADMNRITEIAEAHDLAVVEDAAQAFGARCTAADGAKAGTLGTLGAFSFYPTKTLGAYGDAGLLTTQDDELAQTIRRLRTHGSRPNAKYVHDMLGHNSRLDALQAAILRVKLPRVALASAARRRVAGWYHELLSDTDGVDLPPLHDDHVFHQFTVQLPEERLEKVRGALDEAGIAHQRFYPVPLSSQPVMGTPQARPVADAASARVLSLPVHPGLTPEQVGRVAEVVRGVVQG